MSAVTYLRAQPWVQVAHRGGSEDYPEHSMQAYQRAWDRGYRVFEVAVAVSAQEDGTPRGGELFLLHDQTLDRTSAVTGMQAQSTRWSTIRGMQILPPAGAQPDATPQPYLTLRDYLDAFGDRVVTFLDMKYLWPADRARVYAEIEARGLAGRVVGKLVYGTGNYASVRAIRDEFMAQGMETWGALYPANQPDFTDLAPLHEWLGMDHGASQAVWSDLKGRAAGRPILGHVCASQAHIETARAKGATGVMVASPAASPLAVPPPEVPPQITQDNWEDVRVGGEKASRVYLGSVLVWSNGGGQMGTRRP